MFRDRLEAALDLARHVQERDLRHPLVLGIPRGGVVLGAVLARELDAELDVALARKLRHPDHGELAIGAIAESGEVYLTADGEEVADFWADYLVEECRRQSAELGRQRHLYTEGRPLPVTAGRSVVVVDDGLATGATMIAALKMLRAEGHGRPYDLLVAVPVAAPEAVARVEPYCDGVVCPLRPTWFRAVGCYYRDFAPVDDAAVIRLLRAAARVAM